MRQRADRVLGRVLKPRLHAQGFDGAGGHYVRRTSGVVEVIEAQHSIYGTRITANLGLDLSWLNPLIRWIPRPQLGPHAHDCIRWIRLGLVDEARTDRWWTYDEESSLSLEHAADELAKHVLGPGLKWFEHERGTEAFLRHAERCRERSRSRLQPEGGYLELRLLAVVHAWRGNFRVAQAVCASARDQWEAERARLTMARKIYHRRHPEAFDHLPPVPNLQRELEDITEPTTGARVLSEAGAGIGEAGAGIGESFQEE